MQVNLRLADFHQLSVHRNFGISSSSIHFGAKKRSIACLDPFGFLTALHYLSLVLELNQRDVLSTNSYGKHHKFIQYKLPVNAMMSPIVSASSSYSSVTLSVFLASLTNDSILF